MENKIKILGFTGSLRRNSYNKAALKAAQKLLPENAVLEIADLSMIPFFNEDDEENGPPQAAADFIEKLRASDAVLICTPEYNYSIPPVLKNALDWASREEESPLDGKPLAIMSASLSIFGGIRAQYHLRQVCVVLNLRPLNYPEVFIMNADKKFDLDGNLTDEYTKKVIEELLKALAEEASK